MQGRSGKMRERWQSIHDIWFGRPPSAESNRDTGKARYNSQQKNK
jgi:hypothetical protein